jgi:putative transcriptional regulator
MTAPMNILRDKRLTTKLLMLLELTTNPHHRFKTLAERFDLTVQAVSDYFKIMRKEGLVMKAHGVYRPTQKGILFLHSNFSSLRDFIDGQMHKLNIIDLCVAVAATPLRPGDRVGLFMEDGELKAYKGRSSTSIGIVVSEAGPGEEVGVKGLEGIVAMELGDLHILRVPSVQEGGTRSLDPRTVKKAVESFKADRVAADGTIAKVLLSKANIEPDIEFSMVDSCLEACKKGLRVFAVAEERGVYELVERVNEFNASSEEKIRYTLETAHHGKGKAGARRKA